MLEIFHPYPSKVNILLMRHGESVANTCPRLYDYGDDNLLGLTANGYAQVRDSLFSKKTVRATLGLMDQEHLFLHVSDTLRARQTASIVEYYLREEGIPYTRTEEFAFYKGSAEFYRVNSGRKPEGWDFNKYMRDPFHDFGPEVLNPYELFLEVVTSFRETAQSVVHAATSVNPDTKPTILYIGHHFMFNMLQTYLWSLAMVERGELKHNMLELLTVGKAPDSYVYMEPRDQGSKGNEVRASLRLRAVFQSLQTETLVSGVGGGTPGLVSVEYFNDIYEFTRASNVMLSHALHLPMNNAELRRVGDPLSMEEPNWEYLGIPPFGSHQTDTEFPGIEVPPIWKGDWFHFGDFAKRLEAAYNQLNTHDRV